ncbi:hypothetical protein D3C80_1858470 [compost metagenome]
MKRLVPGFDIHHLNRCHRPVNSGICKDDIQPPPLRGSLLHRFFHLLRVLDITGNHNRFPAFLFNLPFHFFGIFRSTVEHHDFGTVSCEFQHRCPSDA